MTTFLYVRFSGDKQSDERQVDKLTQYLIAHPEFGEEPEWIKDPATSGKKPFANRQGGQRLLAMVEPGDVVIATEVDRIGRKSKDIRRTIELLLSKGVKVYLLNFIQQFIPLDGDDPACAVFLAMWAMIAEMERNLIGQRTKEALQAKIRREGQMIEPCPPGYKRIEMPNGRKAVVIDENEMAAVTLIRHWHSLGIGPTKIAKRLNDMGYRRSRVKLDKRHTGAPTDNRWTKSNVNWALGTQAKYLARRKALDAKASMAEYVQAAEAMT